MEEIVQRVFAILISVIMLFLLPLYIAFEKKDDIAYALALEITQDFVNNVTNKGYLTRDMYDQFISSLALTDNVYSVSIEHIAKKYYPVFYEYKNNKFTASFDYAQFNNNYTYYMEGIQTPTRKFKLNYRMQEEKYYTEQILNELDSNNYLSSSGYSSKSLSSLPLRPNLYRNNMYIMNEGDQFNVIIKNENVTIASVLFNALTLGANNDNNTKVYINYGGTIQNTEYKNN